MLKSVSRMFLCKPGQLMFLQVVSLVMGDSRGFVSVRRETMKFSGPSV